MTQPENRPVPQDVANGLAMLMVELVAELAEARAIDPARTAMRLELIQQREDISTRPGIVSMLQIFVDLLKRHG